MRYINSTKLRLDLALHRSVIRGSEKKAILTLAGASALSLSTLWYLLSVGLILLPVYLWLNSSPWWTILGSFIIGFLHFWTLFPQFIELPPSEVIASPETFPAINRLVKEIATLNGIKPPIVVVTKRFDAAFGRIGPSREPVLLLGHPLMAIMSPLQLVTLIAHEIGHARDGAITRSLFVRVAHVSCRSWLRLLAPNKGWENWSKLTARQRAITLVAAPINLILTAINVSFRFLLARDAARAEYAADRFSVEVSGYTGVSELAEMFALPSVAHIGRTYAQSTPVSRYAAIRHTMSTLDPELAQAVRDNHDRQNTKRDQTLFSWYPPSDLRQAYADYCAPEEARYALSENHFDAIHDELKQWPVMIERRERKFEADEAASQHMPEGQVVRPNKL